MTNVKGPVLVIGATGQQGRAATRHLLERGWEVRAFVRNLVAPAAVALQGDVRLRASGGRGP